MPLPGRCGSRPLPRSAAGSAFVGEPEPGSRDPDISQAGFSRILTGASEGTPGSITATASGGQPARPGRAWSEQHGHQFCASYGDLPLKGKRLPEAAARGILRVGALGRLRSPTRGCLPNRRGLCSGIRAPPNDTHPQGGASCLSRLQGEPWRSRSPATVWSPAACPAIESRTFLFFATYWVKLMSGSPISRSYSAKPLTTHPSTAAATGSGCHRTSPTS